MGSWRHQKRDSEHKVRVRAIAGKKLLPVSEKDPCFLCVSKRGSFSKTEGAY